MLISDAKIKNNPKNQLLIIHNRLHIIKFLKEFLQQFIDRSLVTIKVFTAVGSYIQNSEIYRGGGS